MTFTIKHEDALTEARRSLYDRFASRISVKDSLSRKLVSYQGNKDAPGLRWLKYKEGFSSKLVRSFLGQVEARTFLDPFSGSGTGPLTASSMGMDGTGIEIMPVGNLSARAIVAAANGLRYNDFFHRSQDLIASLASKEYDVDQLFQHIPITERAFPEQTEQDLANARKYVDGIRDPSLQTVLTLACLSVLEEVSYTRKDGQFLRWDPRSGRKVSTRLHKAELPTLAQALQRRFGEIMNDMPALQRKYGGSVPDFVDGSSLTELRKLPDASFDAVVTSQPLCKSVRLHSNIRLGTGLSWLRCRPVEGTAPGATVGDSGKQIQARSAATRVRECPPCRTRLRYDRQPDCSAGGVACPQTGSPQPEQPQCHSPCGELLYGDGYSGKRTGPTGNPGRQRVYGKRQCPLSRPRDSG